MHGYREKPNAISDGKARAYCTLGLLFLCFCRMLVVFDESWPNHPLWNGVLYLAGSQDTLPMAVFGWAERCNGPSMKSQPGKGPQHAKKMLLSWRSAAQQGGSWPAAWWPSPPLPYQCILLHHHMVWNVWPWIGADRTILRLIWCLWCSWGNGKAGTCEHCYVEE